MSELLKHHNTCVPETCPLYDICNDIDSLEECTGLIMGTADNLEDLLDDQNLEADYRESYQKTVDELEATLNEVQEGFSGWEVQ